MNHITQKKLVLSKPLNEAQKDELVNRLKMGTREWAKREINCIKGCRNYCLYCYAKGMAKHFQRCTEDTWQEMEINWKNVNKGYGKSRRQSTAAHDVMFPTSHDIFADEPYYSACRTVLEKLLTAGNTVLITIKPSLGVVTKLIKDLKMYREQITFRFTIGSCDSEVLKLLETNAPSFEERLASLKYATEKGFHSSISAEPLLDETPHALIKKIEPQMSSLDYEKDRGTIWIGLLKKQYVPRALRTGEVKDYMNRVKKRLTFEHVYSYYEDFYKHPRVRWKESIVKLMIKRDIKVRALSD
ncbi:MAG: hypothetical protein GF353_11255 [Candidatus Lokiarchaeota archaeon]|nr:hypothetical protein [Candidatus Lokiarchaeota archaeon]